MLNLEQLQRDCKFLYYPYEVALQLVEMYEDHKTDCEDPAGCKAHEAVGRLLSQPWPDRDDSYYHGVFSGVLTTVGLWQAAQAGSPILSMVGGEYEQGVITLATAVAIKWKEKRESLDKVEVGEVREFDNLKEI